MTSTDLKAAGRQTRQRTAIERYLVDCPGFQTAQQIHDHIRAQGQDIGLATVYRTLQQMADAGQVDVLHADDNQLSYRRCSSTTHHHHLVCRQCGATVEVAGEEIERWAAEVAARHGYTDVNHDIEIFGLCDVCTAEG
jgi:Fur family ferric uptake transcriptional regulator